jgi:hypothetical protein
MQKSQRAAAPAKKSATPSASSQGAAQGGQQDNSFVAELLRGAADQAGVTETTLLSLSDQGQSQGGKYDFAEDGGQYDFAEDGDRKTQQENLPKLREKHEGVNSYADIQNGKSFIKGAGDEHEVAVNDVAQGALGDCYLIAGMIAVARANPQAIADLIKDNGDGTFDVTLYLRSTPYAQPQKVTKTVDARLPVSGGTTPLYAKAGDKSDEGTEIWPALIEKTVAQHKGSYDLISGGNIAKNGFQFHGATELLTGKKEGYMPTAGMSEDDVLLHIQIALDERKPVTVDSKNMEADQAMADAARKYNVYGNHAYCPESVDLDGGTLNLTNPWGQSHVSKLPVADFLRFYRSIRIGG